MSGGRRVSAVRRARLPARMGMIPRTDVARKPESCQAPMALTPESSPRRPRLRIVRVRAVSRSQMTAPVSRRGSCSGGWSSWYPGWVSAALLKLPLLADAPGPARRPRQRPARRDCRQQIWRAQPVPLSQADPRVRAGAPRRRVRHMPLWVTAPPRMRRRHRRLPCVRNSLPTHRWRNRLNGCPRSWRPSFGRLSIVIAWRKPADNKLAEP